MSGKIQYTSGGVELGKPRAPVQIVHRRDRPKAAETLDEEEPEPQVSENKDDTGSEAAPNSPSSDPSPNPDTVPEPIQPKSGGGGALEKPSRDPQPVVAVPYEVGYGRPPRSGCFRKGQRGNPKGRPKGSKSALTIFQEEADVLVTVRENGRTRKMTKFRIGTRTAMNTFAAKGDLKSMLALVKLSTLATAPKLNSNGWPQPEEEQYNPLKDPAEQLMREFVAAWGEGGTELQPKKEDEDEEE